MIIKFNDINELDIIYNELKEKLKNNTLPINKPNNIKKNISLE